MLGYQSTDRKIEAIHSGLVHDGTNHAPDNGMRRGHRQGRKRGDEQKHGRRRQGAYGWVLGIRGEGYGSGFNGQGQG